eukprot:1160371-Pelagomonas_calceolata.AAC.6
MPAAFTDSFSTLFCKLHMLSLGVQVPGRPATIDYIWATSDLDLVAIYNPLKGQGQKLATSCRFLFLGAKPTPGRSPLMFTAVNGC